MQSRQFCMSNGYWVSSGNFNFPWSWNTTIATGKQQQFTPRINQKTNLIVDLKGNCNILDFQIFCAPNKKLTEIFLNSGRLLHHLTILYSRWSAILHKFAIISGLSHVNPALASNGLFCIDAGSAEDWFSRFNSESLNFHRYSTSMISWSRGGIGMPGLSIDKWRLLLPLLPFCSSLIPLPFIL